MTTAETSTASGTATGQQKFKILAADKLAQQGLDWIESQSDAELVNKPGLSEDELAQTVGDHDAMIVRSGVTVTKKVLENPGRLKVIARAGVGVDNIDLEAATQQGILVVNTAEANTITTCEHAIALMLGAARHLGPAYKTMCEGGWDRSKFKGQQMAGKKLGIVGFGRIGQAIAERALAMDMEVLAYDPFVNAETMMDGRVKMHQDFKKMLPELDAVTFHVPLNDKTRGMLGKETFPLCKENLIVINASRGGVVDEDALVEALDNAQVAAAGLDVYVDEPLPADSKLRHHPKILATPHLGASTVEAQQAVSIDAAASVMTFLRGEGVKGAVNAAGLRLDLSPIQQRYVDLSRRMAQLIDPLGEGIERINFEIAGEELASATEMIERQTLVNLLASHLADPVNMVNVRHVADQRGIKTQTVERDADRFGPSLTVEVTGGGKTRRVVGRVYDDLRPRIVEVNGYHIDMVPAGHMVLLLNEDKPGMIGFVGKQFGDVDVNIADMTISRKSSKDGTALMALHTDAPAPEQLLKQLEQQEGIIQVAAAELPAESE
jgi:D-3-phosphoglycerate dehydrogenase